MHAQLSENYQELVKMKDHLLDDLAGWDIEILQKKPDEMRWSVVQIVNHLILVERMSLVYIKKKYPAINELGEEGLKQKLAMKGMKLAQRSTKKFKAPSAVGQPQNEDDLEQLKVEWTKAQGDLKVFLEDYPDKYLKKLLFKHPFVGRLSLAQMMKVNLYHMVRHKSQIDSLLKNFKS